jgi:diguanylate cyclase (GGDEF)-like protein
VRRSESLVLFATLVVAAVLLSVPLTRWVVAAAGIQEAYGFSIIPAVVILAIVLWFASRMRGLEQRAEQASIESQLQADLRRAEEKAQQLAAILRFSTALSGIIDRNTLKQVLETELPVILGTTNLWITTRADGWSLWLDDSGGGESLVDGLARKPGAWESLPLTAAGKTVGVLGIGTAGGSPTPERREYLETVASLVGLAVKNVELFRRVRELSMVDPLTGCLLRHYGLATLAAEMRRARRSGLPLSIMMFDLDAFKELNDRYGHLAGDQALVVVGRVLKETLRASDIRCRYGGEEFLIVLPETGMTGALRAAENLKRQFEKAALPIGGEHVVVTASFGVTEVTPADSQATAVLARADAALYEAKRMGRNRVAAAGGPAPGGGARPPRASSVRESMTGTSGERF